MTPLNLSSGDLVADRRADYAEMLLSAGELSAAAELMRDTLALVPGWTAGWFRLGEMLAQAERLAEAADAWREALRLDPQDRLGASLKLRLIGAAHDMDAPPSAFVEALFDQYAPTFDSQLVEKLGYRVPELLAAALEKAGFEHAVHVIDLGCGTGLMGERLRARASFLEGFDISGKMLRRAEQKRIYDRLARADLQTLTCDKPVVDLVVAADVFIYLGALDHVFAATRAAMLPGGFFAFSVEIHDGPEPMQLKESRRYAHSQAYVREGLAAAGFELLSLERQQLRLDRGEAVEGLIVVARRPAEEEIVLPALVPQAVAASELAADLLEM